MNGTPRSDVPLLVGAVAGLLAAGAVIFAVVDVSMPDERFDSNSPNAVTPGPESSFEER